MNTVTNKLTTAEAFPEHRYSDFVATIQRFARETLNEYQEKHGFLDLYVLRRQDKQLFDIFLENIPENARQHYNCNTCRKWFETFGGVLIVESVEEATRPIDVAISPFWTLLPEELQLIPDVFHNAINAMNAALSTGVEGKSNLKPFYYSSKDYRSNVWGVAEKGGFEHMHFESNPIFDYKLAKPNVNAAENEFIDKRLEPANRNLNSYALEHFETLQSLLKAGSLYTQASALKSVELYIKLHQLRKQNYNLFIKEINLAYDGAILIAGGVVGAALDLIVADAPLDKIQSLWNQMVDPLKYQRQGNVSEGTIKVANKLIAEMGLEDSLLRAFARLEDVEKHIVWKPRIVEQTETSKPSGGVFDKLLNTPAVKDSKIQKYKEGGTIECTWSTFVSKHLPTLNSLSYLRGMAGVRHSLVQLTTEAIKGSKPLYRHDKLENRNPLSFYLYSDGSYFANFNLGNESAEVIGIIPPPGLSDDDNRGGVILLLKGAKDLQNNQSAIFPDSVLPELHPVRAAIEMYSRNTPLKELTPKDKAGFDIAAGVLVPKLEGQKYTRPLFLEGVSENNMLFRYSIYSFE